MKLFVDCQLFDKGFQGTRTYLEGLYKELIKDKSIEFYLGSRNPMNLEKVFGKHENVYYVKYKSKNPLIRLLFDIPYLLCKLKIDFAHFQYRVPPIKVCKYVLTIHDVLFEDFPNLFSKKGRFESFLTYKFSALRSEIIFTVSDYSKAQIQKHLGAKNIYVHPNGVNRLFFDPYDKQQIKGIVQEKFNFSNYILYISRIEPRKKQDLLLELFIKNKIYEKFHLIFVGSTTYEITNLNNLYNALDPQIKQKIKFLSDLTNEDLIDLIKGADFSVYPSIAEGFGIPPLESIAANVPTICSNQTAMSDFKFMNDFHFNPNNVADFNNKLLMLIENGDNQIESKRSFIAENYNWKISSNIFKEKIIDF
jgi:glycosyltransferase involved in cell wall biosynthesis